MTEVHRYHQKMMDFHHSYPAHGALGGRACSAARLSGLLVYAAATGESTSWPVTSSIED
jgi:hypothetical protein